MTIECPECKQQTAERVVFEKHHTEWVCRTCGLRFAIHPGRTVYLKSAITQEV